jgi:hypothetical protein
MELEKARALYEEARAVNLSSSPISSIARVTCLLKYASTFIGKNPKKDELLKEAESRLDGQLYDDREWLATSLNWTKEKVFATLIDLFTKLHALMPEEPVKARQLIQKRIESCKLGFSVHRSEDEKELEATSSSGGKRKLKRVSPDGSMKSSMVFARFAILALVAISAIALYRRFFSRAN